jgi:hypothetical protein
MKTLNNAGQLLLLIVLGLFSLMACTEIEQPLPKPPADTSSAPLPSLALSVEGADSALLDFSPIIAANEPFTLSFSAFQHGRIVLRTGNVVRYISSNDERWAADSGYYDYCQRGNCRRGQIRIVNRQVYSDSVIVALPHLGPFYLAYLSSQDFNLIPTGRTGKITSIAHSYFTANIVAPDSVKLLYFAASGVQGPYLMGFDDVQYRIKTIGDTIFTGTLSLVLGDTCEAQARPDSFLVSGNQSQWSAAQWAVNDEPCFAPLDDYKIRIRVAPYGEYLRIPTTNGILVDTVINDQQVLKYTRTSQAATQDSFPYYLLSNATNRLSRAWVKLKFN